MGNNPIAPSRSVRPTEAERLRELYATGEISLLAYERASCFLIYYEREDEIAAPGVNAYAFEDGDWMRGYGHPTPGVGFASMKSDQRTDVHATDRERRADAFRAKAEQTSDPDERDQLEQAAVEADGMALNGSGHSRPRPD